MRHRLSESSIDLRPRTEIVDPEYDDDLINAFPNLIVRPERDPERSAFEERHSILLGESCRFKECIRHLGRARSLARRNGATEERVRSAGHRAIQAYFAESYDLSPETFDRDAEFFAESLRAARRTIEHVLNEYFPVLLQQRLKMSSVVATEHDPVELLRLCATKGSDIISRIRRFEARRQLTFAQIEFELRLNENGPQSFEEHLARFLRQLDEQYFLTGRSDQYTVIAELDPENANRVKSFEVFSGNDPRARVLPGKSRAVIPLDVRFVSVKGREEIPVFFDARIKRHVPLKLIRKRSRHPGMLPDLCGTRFIFFDETRDLLAGVDHMRRTIVRAPGCVWGEASNAARAGVLDPKNIHSSGEFRAWKYNVLIRNRIVEVQFMYLPFYVNEFVAHGQDNHPVYKLRAYLDTVFPVIFPTPLYGVDWRDTTLRSDLADLQLARI